MIGMLIWKPHLGTLANSLVILMVMGWLCLLWVRYRSRYNVKRTLMLLAPKLLMSILALVALMDPAWRDQKPTDDSLKVAFISDISTSMDVKDDGSDTRTQRSKDLINDIQGELKGIASVEPYRFDVDILGAEEVPAEGTRKTDLGKTIVSLSGKPDLSDCKAVVLFTDGGDENIRSERLPEVPIFILGIGTDPSTWDDLEIRNTDIPEEVELDTPFKVTADIVVHSASKGFARKAAEVEVQIAKRVGGKYQELSAETVNPGKNNGRVEFEIPAEETEGVYHYRLSVKAVDGEMTALNNVRDFEVDIREKSINVLLYGNMLDWNFAMLKREFADDATIKLTSVYRKNAEVFLIDGTRQDGDEVFSSGFPDDEKVLNLYTCIVLGSFPSELLGSGALEGLRKYVEAGGNLVMLGGPQSFDKGGYYNTAIAPLIPWKENRSGPGNQHRTVSRHRPTGRGGAWLVGGDGSHLGWRHSSGLLFGEYGGGTSQWCPEPAERFGRR